MRTAQLIAISAAPFLLGGCIAKTAMDVVTAPVRVASTAVDLATTSQSEADETRGREIRRREERLGRLSRDYEDLAEAQSRMRENVSAPITSARLCWPLRRNFSAVDSA